MKRWRPRDAKGRRQPSSQFFGWGLPAGAILVAFLGLWLAARVAPARASTSMPETAVEDGGRYMRRSSVGTTGLAVKFKAPGSGLVVHNEDDTNRLLIKIVRDQKTPTSEELDAPADNTWTEVQPIPAGETWTFDVRKSPGFIIDREAGTGAAEFRILD